MLKKKKDFAESKGMFASADISREKEIERLERERGQIDEEIELLVKRYASAIGERTPRV